MGKDIHTSKDIDTDPDLHKDLQKLLLFLWILAPELQDRPKQRQRPRPRPK